jgi:hypothetical protein
MADSEWFEIPGTDGDIPNKETAIQMATDAARSTDRVIEVYRCTRTLVRTLQRQVTVQEVTLDSLGP